ncbi:PD-(D/E)XK nuclease family protein [Campylobacter fetus]|uniref:PD-(D/E)XK nuclease family protein n=1 Tax=Campylobacter fetus TaxID=196 RepID=UPI000FCA0C71|nr:PD-(D/E)XK nuclease family protein [Campylobacter fetus]RUT50955.1 hypothetical protein BWK67_00080 [Campylobacter fetus]
MQDLKPLEYKENYTDLIPSDCFRISPSMVSKFNDKKWEWYRSQVLGEDTFSGSTSTVLGTCIHRAAEVFAKKPKEEVIDILEKELPAYIESFAANSDIDTVYIHEQWRAMSEALIDHLRVYGKPTRSEEAIAYEIAPSVYVAGTADALLGNTLIDFKTTSKINPDTTIPFYYRLQLLTYAWIYRKLGVDIQRIKIVWITNNIIGRISDKTGKPMKDYPAKVEAVTEMITKDDMDFIESYLKLIAETYLKAKENPELVYLLYSDYRLKDNNG